MPELREALSALGVPASELRVKKAALVTLLQQKRTRAAAERDHHAAMEPRTQSRRKRRRPNPEDRKASSMSEPESSSTSMSCSDSGFSVLMPYDAKSNESLIEVGDPVVVGWPAVDSGHATWSFAVARQSYNGSESELQVQHYNFDARTDSLLPSWVVEAELTSYLTSNSAPPPELLAKTKPHGHVAYTDDVPVDNILLVGPVTHLQTGFLSQLQHDSVRKFLNIPEQQLCFGKKRSKTSPPCPGCM